MRRAFWPISPCTPMVVPCCQGRPSLETLFRDVLREETPQWELIRVVPFGPYLGFQLGPTAGAFAWNKLVEKFVSRVLELAATVPPAPIAVTFRNVLAISCLANWSQMLLPSGV